MAINEFPTFSNDQDPEFKAHFEAAWEDVSERETPVPSDHGDHPEFKTPPPADIEGQEFLEPERNQVGDPLGGEAPGVPELAIDLHEGPEPPRPQGDLGFAEPGAIEGQTVYESDGPIPVAPLDLEGFEAPAAGESGEPQGATSEPQPQVPMNWAFPIPPQDADEGQAPQEFEGPAAEDIGDTEEFAPQEAARYDEETYQPTGAAQDTPTVDIPAYDTPQPVPIDAMNNEDLFARVGWRTEPPRTANTFWYQ